MQLDDQQSQHLADHETNQNSGDWSLRANGERYFDRSDETQTLLRRLTHSSGSVTGIAGQRGAGKSSLAMRVLSQAKTMGAFTLLIHSPTGYDPEEFLVSIFQRTCEEVTARIDEKFGQAKSLGDLGIAEKARRGALFWTILAGIFFVISSMITYAYFIYEQNNQEFFQVEILNEEKFNKEMNDLQQKSDELDRKIHQSLSDETTSDAEKSILALERNELDERLNSAFVELEKIREMRERNISSFSRIPFYLLVFSFAIVIFYVLILFASRSASHAWRQLNLARRFPQEHGLRAKALDLLEHLRYQTIVTSQSEAELGIAKLITKFSREKSLEARPLSLPGLTAELGNFLELVAEVHAERVVICLDELDKVEDPAELDRILRAIKGILGHRNTHFLLTVSEDALARFSTRQRMDRGMLESSFEDIIFLDRVDLETAGKILATMGVLQGTTHDAAKAFQFWLFASAIPREIKRNALSCLEIGIDVNGATPADLWRKLIVKRLNSLRLWGTQIGKDDEMVYHFLQLLESTRIALEAIAPDDEDDLKQILRPWMDYFRQISAKIADCRPRTEEEDLLASYALGRAALETMVGLTGVFFAGSKINMHELRQAQDQLLPMFEMLPSNLRFADELFQDLMLRTTQLGVLDPTGAAT